MKAMTIHVIVTGPPACGKTTALRELSSLLKAAGWQLNIGQPSPMPDVTTETLDAVFWMPSKEEYVHAKAIVQAQEYREARIRGIGKK